MATVRIFETDQQARVAADALRQEGFRSETISVIAGIGRPAPAGGEEGEAAPAPAPIDASAMVDAAVKDGRLPNSHARTAKAALERGRSLVSVEAPFGSEGLAIRVMNANGAVDSDTLPSFVIGDDPAPFSDLLGIPVLSRSRSSAELSNRYTFPSWLGLGLTSNKAAPLSSMFGMKPLSAPKRNWKNSFGFPMLTRSQGPVFGVKLKQTKPGWNSSFGFPLLSKNATPMSSMFGMSVLSGKKEGDWK